MKYRVVYHFRWLLVIFLLALIYVSNFILIKLPFVNFSFMGKSGFLPDLSFDYEIYNIQTVLVWAIGVIFGELTGLITTGIYILIGLIGFPVFAGGGGIGYYNEPTFGYLISFPLLAFLSGYFYKKNKKFFAVFIPVCLTHLFGILYLLLFQQKNLDLTWHLSFSMITYDLIFAFLLIPLVPFLSFFLKEMFIQEVKAI